MLLLTEMSLGSEFEKVEARETPTTTPRQGRSAKELLHEFAQYTTAHGLNKIVESTGWARKLIWVAFCLSCFTVCLTEIMQLYKQYVDKPVSTVISVKEELVRTLLETRTGEGPLTDIRSTQVLLVGLFSYLFLTRSN